jgi:hypothetical protein
MPDMREIWARLGFGDSPQGQINQGQDQGQGGGPAAMQSGQQPSSGGHWWERLFGPRQEEVPPPALPEKLKLPSAWELARTGQLDNMRIGGNKKAGYRTLGDLTNILFNENRALSAGDVKKGFAGPEKLKEAKHAMAHAIINNTLYHPTKVASPRIDKKAQQSPEYKRDFADYQ